PCIAERRHHSSSSRVPASEWYSHRSPSWSRSVRTEAFWGRSRRHNFGEVSEGTTSAGTGKARSQRRGPEFQRPRKGPRTTRGSGAGLAFGAAALKAAPRAPATVLGQGRWVRAAPPAPAVKLRPSLTCIASCGRRANHTGVTSSLVPPVSLAGSGADVTMSASGGKPRPETRPAAPGDRWSWRAPTCPGPAGFEPVVHLLHGAGPTVSPLPRRFFRRRTWWPDHSGPRARSTGR